MRFYELTLTNPANGKVMKQWSSYPNGQADPAALNISFDMVVSPGDLPAGGVSIVVEGVALEDLTNAQKYASIVENGQAIGGALLTLRGGMQAGLSLASPAQAGLLVHGAVYQSWGTWVGTDMSLSFLVVPSTFTPKQPGGFVFQWQEGQPIGPAIDQTLSTVYPGVPIKLRVSPELLAKRSDMGFYATFQQFAQHVQQLTEGRLGASYGGVRMAYGPKSIVVYDGTQPGGVKRLDFTDFIGQPAWVQYDTIQVKTVLRADIQVNDYIEFPKGFESAPGFVQTGPNAYPVGAKYQSIIQGVFQVNQIRHIGNFRDPDGGAWATLFNCVPANPTGQ